MTAEKPATRPIAEDYRHDRETIMRLGKVGTVVVAGTSISFEIVSAIGDLAHQNEIQDNFIEIAKWSGVAALGLASLTVLNNVIDRALDRHDARHQG